MKSMIKDKYTLKSFNQIKDICIENKMKNQFEINQLKSRACIRTTLISDFGLIIIKNTGLSDALNVEIILDGIPIENYPGIFIKKKVLYHSSAK